MYSTRFLPRNPMVIFSKQFRQPDRDFHWCIYTQISRQTDRQTCTSDCTYRHFIQVFRHLFSTNIMYSQTARQCLDLDPMVIASDLLLFPIGVPINCLKRIHIASFVTLTTKLRQGTCLHSTEKSSLNFNLKKITSPYLNFTTVWRKNCIKNIATPGK